MDETALTSNRKFKVLTPLGKRPLCIDKGKYSHLTACITLNSTEFYFKPLIILPNKSITKGLEDVLDELHLASTSTGWMNRAIFTLYCIIFISQVLEYRLTLPEELRSQRVLLIVAGHSSRINFLAALLQDLFYIDLLVLPGHCSHLLQPFDITVASALKTAFKKALLDYEFDFNVILCTYSQSKKNST